MVDHGQAIVAEEDSHEDVSMLPHSLWGLDPLFHARIKLNISDVMQLKDYQGYTGVWRILNHPIVKVCIMGDVQQIDYKEKFIIFHVDDGTECIGCKWNIEPNNQPNVKLGDLVRVVGRVSEFNGRKDINAVFICKEPDPNCEMLHWLETVKLKKTIYNKPFQLPKSFDNCQRTSAIYDLKAKLLQYLNELEKVCAHNSSTDASNEIIDPVIKMLEKEGYIVSNDCEDKKYQFLSDKLLVPEFLSIFKKYKNSSISIVKLHQEFLQTDFLKHITTQRIQQVLSKLVDDNYIYPIDEYHYHIVC